MDGNSNRTSSCAILTAAERQEAHASNSHPQIQIFPSPKLGGTNDIDGGAVLGEDVTSKHRLICVGTKVLPNKGLDTSYLQPEVVM